MTKLDLNSLTPVTKRKKTKKKEYMFLTTAHIARKTLGHHCTIDDDDIHNDDGIYIKEELIEMKEEWNEK